MGSLPWSPGEQPLFSPSVLASGKNVSFDPATGQVGGSALGGEMFGTLGAMLSRFSDEAQAFVERTCPEYAPHVTRGRTSFRPVEIAGRPSSWRKDDTRLHIDAFPATPVQGRRILRVFANVNPHGRPRSWRIGDSFDAVGRLLRAGAPHAVARRRCGAASAADHEDPRSPYDALMLQLHDRMKADTAYQQARRRRRSIFRRGRRGWRSPIR